MHHFVQQEENSMSLAVAIEANEGIVLAADSRATYGDPRGLTAVNDTVQKIYKLSPRSAIALVGAAETGASLIQHITSGLAPQPGSNVDQVAETIRTLGNQYFAQWFGPPQYLMGPAGPQPTPRPDIWFLLVGHSANGQPKIISLGSASPFNFAPNLSTTGFATAGVVPLAIYRLNRLYRRNLAIDIAKDLAAYCIAETASQDGKVGGPIRLAVARPNTDIAVLDDAEVGEVMARADRHRESLRNSFLNSVRQPAGAAAQVAAAEGGKH
jgi:20S proteasome alpha/beta subunit